MSEFVDRARPVLLAIVIGVLCAGCATSQPTDEIPAEKPAASPAAPAADASSSTVTGKAPAAKGGLHAVVILNPTVDREFPAAPYVPVMDQVSLSFVPAVLFVRTGQPAEFRNSDDTLHNVRVYEDETREAAFNVALPTGGTYSYTMKRDGFYNVGCDIHPEMTAVVVASGTPYTALAALDGRFAIEGVLPGEYRLTVYADVVKIERDVTVAPGGGPTELGDVTGP